MFRMTSDRYEAIIGFQIGTVITTDISLVRAAIKLNKAREIQLIKKGVADLMAEFDLGPNWDNLAKEKILFYLKNGDPITISQYEQEIDQKGI